MAKTANEHVLDVLAQAKQPVGLASLGKQLGAQGVKYATVSKATQELLKRKQIVLVRRGVYALPEFAEATASSSKAVAPLAPSLGVSLGQRDTTGAKREAEALHELLDALGDGPSTFDGLVESTGWTRAELLAQLREASWAGKVHCVARGSEQLYLLAGEQLASLDAPEAQQGAPSSPATVTSAPADINRSDVEAIEVAVFPAIPAGGLPERLTAITQDIEDALGDACDAQLPHDLIKALVVANGAAHRAARLLGA